MHVKYLVEVEIKDSLDLILPETIGKEIYTTLTTHDSEEIGIKSVKVTQLKESNFALLEMLK